MSKKWKKQKELEETVKQAPTSNDCPDPHCGTHFYGSACARESHMKLYPSHFTGEKQAPSNKEDAVLVDLKSKRGKPKHEEDKLEK